MQANPKPSNPTIAPANHTSVIPTHKPGKSLANLSPPARPTSRHHPTCLILNLDNKLNPTAKFTVEHRDEVNGLLDRAVVASYIRVTSAFVSNTGNLVIQTRDSTSASELPPPPHIDKFAKAFVGSSTFLAFLDSAWHTVQINDIPTRPYGVAIATMTDIQQELTLCYSPFKNALLNAHKMRWMGGKANLRIVGAIDHRPQDDHSF